jgi:hypothetical protein
MFLAREIKERRMRSERVSLNIKIQVEKSPPHFCNRGPDCFPFNRPVHGQVLPSPVRRPGRYPSVVSDQAHLYLAVWFDEPWHRGLLHLSRSVLAQSFTAVRLRSYISEPHSVHRRIFLRARIARFAHAVKSLGHVLYRRRSNPSCLERRRSEARHDLCLAIHCNLVRHCTRLRT